MADKVKWERWGFLIVEEGTHTIVADCRYKDPTSTIEKWKHNRDEDVNKHEAMVQEILDSHNVGIATMRLLESLTPRGSEFHNDPERCVEWVRERLSGVIKQVIKRKEAEAEVKLLREILDDLQWIEAPTISNKWCPWCRSEQADGHHEACELHSAIQPTTSS